VFRSVHCCLADILIAQKGAATLLVDKLHRRNKSSVWEAYFIYRRSKTCDSGICSYSASSSLVSILSRRSVAPGPVVLRYWMIGPKPKNGEATEQGLRLLLMQPRGQSPGSVVFHANENRCQYSRFEIWLFYPTVWIY